MCQIDRIIPKSVSNLDALVLADYAGYKELLEKAETDPVHEKTVRLLQRIYQAYVPAIVRIHIALNIKTVHVDLSGGTLQISHAGAFEDGCLVGRTLEQGIRIHLNTDESDETLFNCLTCYSECCYTDANYVRQGRFVSPVTIDSHKLSITGKGQTSEYLLSPQLVNDMTQYFETDGFEFIGRYFHRSNPVSAQPTTTWTSV